MFVVQVLKCPLCGGGSFKTAHLLFTICPFCSKVFKVNLDKVNLVTGNFKEFLEKKKRLKKYDDEKLQRIYKKVCEFALRRLPNESEREKRDLKAVGWVQNRTFREKAFVHRNGISE